MGLQGYPLYDVIGVCKDGYKCRLGSYWFYSTAYDRARWAITCTNPLYVRVLIKQDDFEVAEFENRQV